MSHPLLLARVHSSALPRTLFMTTSPTLVLSSSQDQLKDEVRDMAKKLGAAGMNLLVIDTGALCWGAPLLAVHACQLGAARPRGCGLWPWPFVAGSE